MFYARQAQRRKAKAGKAALLAAVDAEQTPADLGSKEVEAQKAAAAKAEAKAAKDAAKAAKAAKSKNKAK